MRFRVHLDVVRIGTIIIMSFPPLAHRVLREKAACLPSNKGVERGKYVKPRRRIERGVVNQPDEIGKFLSSGHFKNRCVTASDSFIESKQVLHIGHAPASPDRWM